MAKNLFCDWFEDVRPAFIDGDFVDPKTGENFWQYEARAFPNAPKTPLLTRKQPEPEPSPQASLF